MKIRDLFAGMSVFQIIKEFALTALVVFIIQQYFWLLDALGVFGN
jgi:hypothetical protein